MASNMVCQYSTSSFTDELRKRGFSQWNDHQWTLGYDAGPVTAVVSFERTSIIVRMYGRASKHARYTYIPGTKLIVVPNAWNSSQLFGRHVNDCVKAVAKLNYASV